MFEGERISIGMVLYHSGPDTLDTVKCILNSTVRTDLHIVDNSPEDGLASSVRALAPCCTVHTMKKNVGYGAGNNAVLHSIHSVYHVIMNPDITFESDLLQRMAAYMDAHPDITILTPRVFFTDGTEQDVPRMAPTVRRMLGGSLENRFALAKKWRDEYSLRNMEVDDPLSVEFATGCFMFVRTHALFRLKGFDERFFLYMEDADLSRRAAQLGAVVYHPDFCVQHRWRRESAHSTKARLAHLRSAVRYFRKWGWAW